MLMAQAVITGDMFTIALDGPRAEIRIWRRADLDYAAGARNAERLEEEGAKLPSRGVRAILLDVVDAPAVAGPKTVASLGKMMAAWASARVKIAVLVDADPIKVLQFKRVLTENAPRDGRVLTDRLEAKTWLASVT
jgi:hypothetical protein